MKKLALLIYSMAGGGAERVVSQWLPQLCQTYQVHLVLMSRQIDYPLPKEVTLHFLETSTPRERGWTKVLKLPWLAWKFRQYCLRKKISLSVSFLFRPNYINVLAYLLGSGAKTVINERIHPSTQYQGNGLTARISNFLIRQLYPRAHQLVVNSKGVARDFKDNYQFPSEIKVVYNPVDVRFIEEQKDRSMGQEKKHWFFGDRMATYFVCVARLHEQKQIHHLIEAMAKVKNDDFHLVLFGQGTEEKRLRQLAKDLGISLRVHFKGFVENPFVYMAGAEAFILPSSHEGFPNVILEALACGVPVLSTDCPSGPREILAPHTPWDQLRTKGLEWSEYGGLVPVGGVEEMAEGMELLLEDKSLKEKYRRRGPDRAKDFSIKPFVEQFESIFEIVEKR